MASDFFADSFDHYATADINSKWTRSASSPTIGANGRRSTSAIRFPSAGAASAHKGVTSSVTAMCGFAFKTSSLAFRFNILEFMDATNSHVIVGIETDGSITVGRGSGAGDYCGTAFVPTNLGSSIAGLISTGTFYHLEVKCTIDNSAGVVEVRLNGTAVLTLTGKDTQNAGTTAITQVGIGGYSALNVDVDDFTFRWNSSTFWGDVRVDALFPTAEGATIAWTPSTGTDNSALVDETTPNSDTDYNSSSVSGDIDTLVTQDCPSGAQVKGVQVVQFSRKTDAGACNIAPVIRHSGTNYVGADVSVATAYAFQQQGYLQNPGTSADWTEANVNAAEFGYKRTA